MLTTIAICDFAIGVSQFAINIDSVGAPSQSDGVRGANHQQGSTAEVLGITQARLGDRRARTFGLGASRIASNALGQLWQAQADVWIGGSSRKLRCL